MKLTAFNKLFERLRDVEVIRYFFLFVKIHPLPIDIAHNVCNDINIRLTIGSYV